MSKDISFSIQVSKSFCQFHSAIDFILESENYQSGKKGDWEGPLCKFAAHKKMLVFFGILLIFWHVDSKSKRLRFFSCS